MILIHLIIEILIFNYFIYIYIYIMYNNYKHMGGMTPESKFKTHTEDAINIIHGKYTLKYEVFEEQIRRHIGHYNNILKSISGITDPTEIEKKIGEDVNYMSYQIIKDLISNYESKNNYLQFLIRLLIKYFDISEADVNLIKDDQKLKKITMTAIMFTERRRKNKGPSFKLMHQTLVIKFHGTVIYSDM